MIEKIGIAGFLCATICALPMLVAAQQISGAKPVWRCGSTYSDQPCAGGKSVDVDDARSAADRHAANAATRHAASSASAMERDRVHLERDAVQREQANARANALAKARLDKAAHPAAPPRSSRKHKAGHLPPDYFTARGENSPAKKPTRVSSK